MRQQVCVGGATAALLCALSLSTPARAAEVPGWYSRTDFNAALTRGNSDTLNVGLNAEFTRKWLRTDWKTRAIFSRNDVSEPTRRAVSTCVLPCDTVADARDESGPNVTKSEKMFADSTFKRRVTERFFWNAAGSFERDKFAGLDNRLVAFLGVGYRFENRDKTGLFDLTAGPTYTTQKEVIDDPETVNQFAGARVAATGDYKFGDTKNSTFSSQLVVDENLQDTADLRSNWVNRLTVAMGRRLSVNLSAQLVYDNQPQLVELTIFRTNVAGNLVETQSKKNFPAKKLDATISAGITITFSPGGVASRPGVN
jgi:hypothetical protein